jgi:hypothetical protein
MLFLTSCYPQKVTLNEYASFQSEIFKKLLNGNLIFSIITFYSFNDAPRRQVIKMKKSIIFLCLIVFTLAYAGCTVKQLKECDETVSAQKDLAIKPNEQPSVAGEPEKQNNSEGQKTRESAVSQIATYLKDIHFDFDKYNLRPVLYCRIISFALA